MSLPFEYKIIRSDRQTIGITVSATKGVIVRSPLRCSNTYIQKMVKDKESWIIKSIQENKAASRSKIYIKSGETLLYLGKPYEIKVSEDSQGNSLSVDIDSRYLSLNLPNHKVTQSERRDAVKQWYLDQAKDVIPDRVHSYAELMGLTYHHVKIKTLRSRWGSCSSLKNVNFNWVLIMCPIKILDYVVIHELAHLVHMNHSADFWGVVKTWCPDYRDAIQWLKHNSGLIDVL